MRSKTKTMYALFEQRQARQNEFLTRISDLEKEAMETAKNNLYKNCHTPIVEKMMSATDDFLLSLNNYRK